MGFSRVSFVVTCFNLGAYLPEALASIRAQTFQDFETCIVDDGSTDAHTLQVLSALASDVKVVRSDQNRGLSAARNLGVSNTSGEYICAVDADDLLAPTLLEASVARFDSDPSIAFVSHWLEAFGDESWEWKPERCDFPSLLNANTVNGAALVRRSAVEAVGGWDENMRDGCEDWDFWITMVERGFRGEIIPEILFRYRRRADSMSRVNFADDGLSRLFRRLVDKHSESFRPFVNELAARRDVDITGNRALADDLEQRLELEILPALARARDDLAAAERRRAQWDHQRRTETEREQLLDEASSLRNEAESLHAQLDAARDQTLHLYRLRDSALQEVAALRTSLSWRLTQPLRSIGTLVRRVARPRS